jgi:hypothetical protein
MTSAEHGSFETRLLTEAARRTSYPPTPDLRARVVVRITAERASRSAASPFARRVALAVITAAFLAVALTLALPTSRHAIGEFFGLVPGERIERLTPTATPTASASPASSPAAIAPTPPPTFSGIPHDYAQPVTLAQARDALGFEPALPQGQGSPDGIYIAIWGQQPLLILEYPNFDLWQTRGGGFVGRGLPDNAEVQTPSVRSNEPAYWVVSGPYDFRFYDAQGHEVRGARRTVTSHVLIWRGAQSYYRIETELSLQDALVVARTLP